MVGNYQIILYWNKERGNTLKLYKSIRAIKFSWKANIPHPHIIHLFKNFEIFNAVRRFYGITFDAGDQCYFDVSPAEFFRNKLYSNKIRAFLIIQNIFLSGSKTLTRLLKSADYFQSPVSALDYKKLGQARILYPFLYSLPASSRRFYLKIKDFYRLSHIAEMIFPYQHFILDKELYTKLNQIVFAIPSSQIKNLILDSEFVRIKESNMRIALDCFISNRKKWLHSSRYLKKKI